MKLLACQVQSQGMTTKKKRDDNINRIFDSIRSANETNNIDLVVLPELSTIEYSTEAFRNVKELAEPIDGETFYKASKLSKEINAYMAYGFPRIEMGNYFISHVVINPNGRYVTHYDKIHIAQFGASEEKPFFERGNKLGIFEVGDVKIGIIICYDFRFTEYVRHIARGYELDLILHPSAFTRDNSFESWHHFVITRALENQVYYLSLNRSGKNWGNSIFCPPWIDSKIKPVVMGEEECLEILKVSKQQIMLSRDTYPFYQDKLKHYENLKP